MQSKFSTLPLGTYPFRTFNAWQSSRWNFLLKARRVNAECNNYDRLKHLISKGINHMNHSPSKVAKLIQDLKDIDFYKNCYRFSDRYKALVFYNLKYTLFDTTIKIEAKCSNIDMQLVEILQGEENCEMISNCIRVLINKNWNRHNFLQNFHNTIFLLKKIWCERGQVFEYQNGHKIRKSTGYLVNLVHPIFSINTRLGVEMKYVEPLLRITPPHTQCLVWIWDTSVQFFCYLPHKQINILNNYTLIKSASI